MATRPIEGTERFFLKLSNPRNATISRTRTRLAGVILDDETTVQLVPINGTTVLEDGGTFAEFQVVRGGDLSNAVSVQFETIEGTREIERTASRFHGENRHDHLRRGIQRREWADPCADHRGQRTTRTTRRSKCGSLAP